VVMIGFFFLSRLYFLSFFCHRYQDRYYGRGYRNSLLLKKPVMYGEVIGTRIPVPRSSFEKSVIYWWQNGHILLNRFTPTSFIHNGGRHY
jgi:hypothetical protein